MPPSPALDLAAGSRAASSCSRASTRPRRFKTAISRRSSSVFALSNWFCSSTAAALAASSSTSRTDASSFSWSLRVARSSFLLCALSKSTPCRLMTPPSWFHSWRCSVCSCSNCAVRVLFCCVNDSISRS